MFVLATTCSSWLLTGQQVVTSNLLLSIAAQSAHKVQDKWNCSGEFNKVLKSIPLLSLMFSAFFFFFYIDMQICFIQENL